MTVTSDEGTTGALLGRLADGEDAALGLLWQRVHGKVRRMAQSALGREGAGPTIDATDLANEVWVKLHGHDQTPAWRTRAHFFGSVGTVQNDWTWARRWLAARLA